MEFVISRSEFGKFPSFDGYDLNRHDFLKFYFQCPECERIDQIASTVPPHATDTHECRHCQTVAFGSVLVIGISEHRGQLYPTYYFPGMRQPVIGLFYPLGKEWTLERVIEEAKRLLPYHVDAQS